MKYDFATVLSIYQGSDGEATKALYAALTTIGDDGVVAINLFRACKGSERAKKYRGGERGRSYRGMAYDRKQWALKNIVWALTKGSVGISWGWGIDELLRDRGDPHYHVLYVDLPTGQVSFHTGERGVGPPYPGAWDGVREAAAGRICRHIANLFEGK